MGILEKLFGKTKVHSRNERTVNEQKGKPIYPSKDTSRDTDIRLYYYDVDGNECEKLIRDGEMWTTITGIRFRRNSEKIMASIYEGATIVLKPEPDNPVDPYAVAVYFKDELIGYVPKKDVPAILTCISPRGTEARINKIDPKFIGVILPGTMEYANSHECLSRFQIMVVRSERENTEFRCEKLSELNSLEEELRIIEKAKDILEEGIEESTDGHIQHESQFEIEGDEEFDEDEIAEWGSHSLRIPFTDEMEKQFMDIIRYLLSGSFMCFKGDKELGEGVYYCQKYDAYLRFKDSIMDAHIRKGHRVAFFIRNLDMSNRPKDIDLTIALNLY